jgi:transposase
LALISNVETVTFRDLLKEYKEQTVVEERFKFIKHSLYVGPMYLKNKDRMEALSYIILMALMIYIVLQRRARNSLETEKEPLEITGGKNHLFSDRQQDPRGAPPRKNPLCQGG